MIPLMLILSLAHATPPPEAWTKWLAEYKQELAAPYSSYTARDMARIKPDSVNYVSREDDDWHFTTTAEHSIARVNWPGGSILSVTVGTSVKRLALKKDGPRLKLTPTRIHSSVTIEAFKRENEAHLMAFLYDPTRADLAPIRRLAVFDYDPQYRVRGTYRKLAAPADIHVNKTRWEPQDVRKTGVIEFKLGGASEHLSVMVGELSDQHVLLLFRDPSNKNETYAGGRFLDLDLKQPAGELADGADVWLDFNFAFEPMCSRSHAFNCPVPDERVATSVRAGERRR